MAEGKERLHGLRVREGKVAWSLSLRVREGKVHGHYLRVREGKVAWSLSESKGRKGCMVTI